MPQISLRLLQRPNRKPLRHRTPAKPPNLRKNEPHPVAPLLPRPQLLAHPRIHAFLRLFESPQVVRISSATHFESRTHAAFQFDARSNADGRHSNFLGIDKNRSCPNSRNGPWQVRYLMVNPSCTFKLPAYAFPFEPDPPATQAFPITSPLLKIALLQHA